MTNPRPSVAHPVKCLIWDLDNTLWSGSLLEDGKCHLRAGVVRVLRELDRRGVLLSIASANDDDLARSFLKKKGLLDLFLHPRINWTNKAQNIAFIARRLNIALDSVGFIDDEPYERAQVRALLPEVRAYHARQYRELLNLPEFHQQFATREGRSRRAMYMRDARRLQVRRRMHMSHAKFLRWCRTELTVRSSRIRDLPRVLELLHRTHQLNATGTIFRPHTIRSFFSDPRFRIYVAELRDRFVDYGIVGVTICRRYRHRWRLVSFLLSCRVLGRGIGNALILWLQRQAAGDGAQVLEGLYVPRTRNHPMAVLYQLAGFTAIRDGRSARVIFSKPVASVVRFPPWLKLKEQGTR